MIRTFIDSGVLIAAARSTDSLSAPALAVLADSNRQFISSDFVRLEVLPKPIYFKRTTEVTVYLAFFAAVQIWVQPTATLVHQALLRAEQFGLGAVDALHVVSAEMVGADEFVTAERPTSPLLRVTSIKVVSIQQPPSSASP
jgi:predicted nucleic acid-binding protein